MPIESSTLTIEASTDYLMKVCWIVPSCNDLYQQHRLNKGARPSSWQEVHKGKRTKTNHLIPAG